MTTYSARRLNGNYGYGYYIIKQENGVESVLPMFYHGDFPESRFEAEQLAKHLTERSRSKSKMFIQDNRSKRRVNG